MAIEINNQHLFGKVIAEALSMVQENTNIPEAEKDRWTNAINKAVVKLGDLKYQMQWMTEAGHLLVWSDSDEIYEANGSCQCEAYKRNLPCWHRALAKLIKNYLAAEEPPKAKAAVAMEDAPYLPPSSNRKPEWVGNYRI